jgi:hypothetical protein
MSEMGMFQQLHDSAGTEPAPSESEGMHFDVTNVCRVPLLKYQPFRDSLSVETSLIVTAASFAHNNLLRSRCWQR